MKRTLKVTCTILSNILEVMFVIAIHCVFKSVRSLNIYYNKFVLIFDINVLKSSKYIKKTI
jgi:hypothetical protein